MSPRSIVFLILLITAYSTPLKADDSGQWEMISLNFNDGNQWVTGDMLDDSFGLAYGVEKGSNGSAPVFKRTVNGGESWSAVTLPNFGGMFTFFTDIQIINENLAFAAGLEVGVGGNSAGPIWRVTNKGQDLEPLIVRLGEFPDCRKLFCLNADRCWATCAEGEIIRTSNGGENWQSGTLPVTDLQPGPIHFINENEGWCAMYDSETTEPQQEGEEAIYTVFDKGSLFKTTNGGQNWTQLTSGEHYTYSSLQMIDDQTGFLAAADETHGYLMKTTNGGQNWFIQPLPPSVSGQFGDMPLFIVGGLHFFDTQTGWITASYGEPDSHIGAPLYFYYTENGGTQWEAHQATNPTDSSTVGGIMFDFAVVDEHLAYGFGDYQMVVRYTDGQYEPPVDGDDPDGDGDTDGEVDTGPIYTGAPGEPCPVPGDSSTYDLPRCDPAQNSGVCVWKDDVAAHCTATCNIDSDCRSLSPDACCKPVTFEDRTERLCLLDSNHCIDYSGQWYGYWGALLGEPCKDESHPDNPDRDPAYGGDFCIDEQTGAQPFCSQACTSDIGCEGGFQSQFCCTGTAQDMAYCRFGAACDPEPEDGDTPIDGDTPTDGDIPTDGDGSDTGGSATTEGSSGGCGQGTPAAGLTLLLLLGLRLRRSRKIRLQADGGR